MKKFSKLNETKLSGKEIEIGKPYAEWTEAEKAKVLLDMAADGFDLHFNPNELQRMTKEEIIEKCKWFSEWIVKLKR